VTAYRVRLAAAPDAEAICRIYNQGIEDRVATLETELRTPDERCRWLANRSPRHPVIVAEVPEGLSADAEPGRAYLCPPSVQAGLSDPATIGWASLTVFNAREAYRFVADISVYVERGWRGRGVGRALLES
jgi:L-amino acid N-acyltransferase YncA